MWALHRKSEGKIYCTQHIILMMMMEEKLTPIKINTWEFWTVIGCLDTRVGVNQVHLVTSTLIRDRVCWQRNITVVHWVFFPVGGKC